MSQACTLRCRYCMPAQGLPLIPRDELLSAGEVTRLVDVAVGRLGIDEVRLTGGEPLVRGDLELIVAGIRARHPRLPIALTTNGIGLARRAAGLAHAGLTRVNISLDTVDRELFEQVTRRDRLDDVIAGIDAAVAAGLAPVKVNAVLLPETLSRAPELLRWCCERGLELRFIESMPLDAERAWSPERLVSADDLLEELGTTTTLTPVGRDDPSAPAAQWLVDGGPHRVGIIASMTRSFCGSCDRTRITAEGRVRPCLFSDDEIDLAAILRSGGSDDDLADAWRAVTWRKRAGHSGVEDVVAPRRTMGAIGG
ncbi:molybdenum cofactor biosynthesis protein MoaA [Gordonia araii NBRC 100433]|uniref:Molybdenum cofactor biosynthesis protein MoaA n=1 Tax=Gordonia araii NBRC 100433 TaxID=1073574 RepID=G7H112_9ACTN|nr:molybdenum cofactor biosynthesis protein MoaA [Gordonia araii NBRC 100433]